MLAVPLFAQAGMLSIFTLLFEKSAQLASADTTASNSQTMALLEPAVNLDPNPAKGGGDITVVDGSALVPADGPSGVVSDTEDTPQSSQISVYTVRSGDNLSGIAAMFNVSVNTIVWANDIQGGVIHPGEELIILPVTGIRHTVVAGDTIANLATKYKSNARDIADYNNLDASSTLAVGTVVIIPDGVIASTPSSTKAPSASSSHTAAIKSIASGATTEPYLGGSGPAIPGYFAWPLDGGIITQGLHGWNAVDIGAPKGTSIFAAAAGTVIVAKNNGAWNGGYGNYVVIQHSNGTQTLYAHMSQVLASVGDQVVQGQTIGKVGMTGEATGNHLHFEVRGAQNPFAN
ncbi:MAG TPA: M23 family metallopeptidase [Candidatus Paceibacterota bacterium]|nr:M23 family metallopeptidase [Candidatus Paceibacterota bacterium]